MDADILGRSGSSRPILYPGQTGRNSTPRSLWAAAPTLNGRAEWLVPPDPDPSLSLFRDVAFYRESLSLPWCVARGRLTVATADASHANLCRLKAHYGEEFGLVRMSRSRFTALLQARFAADFLDQATCALERRYPELSARRRLTRSQAYGLLGACLSLVLTFCLAAPAFNAVALCLLTVAFLANVLFRAMLVWLGAAPVAMPPPAAGSGSDMPLYSIIVPLYREAEIVPVLIDALLALDYPADRLEIALVLEEDDAETIAAVETLTLDGRFIVLTVPKGMPRTKPKAANYALGFVRGAFTVIYDAEDRPEPDQLRKALARFQNLPRNVGCLQARLNFYNAKENWLTRLFTLDYALWFDFLLPGLDRIGVPMPLGGTSNHFRTGALRAIAGWDPYNVTEDADLGVRLARLGLRVMTLDSTTYEEAPIELGNWLRQRSRWMKGYMQTWLVHMRNPRRLLRNAGLWGFLGFQLFVGGTFLTALLNPILWTVFLWSQLAGAVPHATFLSAPLATDQLLGLVIGNMLFTYLAMLGPYRRGWLELAPYGLTVPAYWLLISAASYRGLWQLFTRPWHWEKTHHGRTRRPCAGTKDGAY